MTLSSPSLAELCRLVALPLGALTIGGRSLVCLAISNPRQRVRVRPLIGFFHAKAHQLSESKYVQCALSKKSAWTMQSITE